MKSDLTENMFQYQQNSSSYPSARSFNPTPVGANTQGQQLHGLVRLTAQDAPSTNKRSATDTFQPANDPPPQAKRPRTDGRRFHLHIASRQNQPPQQACPRGPALTEALPPKCEQPGHPGCQRNSSCRYFNDSVPLRLQWMVHACACHRGQPPPGSQGCGVHYGPAQQCVIPPQTSPREQGPGRWNPGGPQYSSRPQQASRQQAFGAPNPAASQQTSSLPLALERHQVLEFSIPSQLTTKQQTSLPHPPQLRPGFAVSNQAIQEPQYVNGRHQYYSGQQYSIPQQLSSLPPQFRSPSPFSLPQFSSAWRPSVREQCTKVRIGLRQDVPPVSADLTQRNVRERPLSLPGLHPENPIRIVEVNMESYPLFQHSERVRDRLKALTSPALPKERKPDALVNVAMAQLPCGWCYIPGCRHCPELIRRVLGTAA